MLAASAVGVPTAIVVTANIAQTRMARRDLSAIIAILRGEGYGKPTERTPTGSLFFRDPFVAALVRRDCVMDLTGVTCGDASYSNGSRKILDERVANLEKCSDCRDKGLPNGLIT